MTPRENWRAIRSMEFPFRFCHYEDKALCVNLGFPDKDGDIVENPALDPPFQEERALYHAKGDFIAGNIVCGPSTAHCVGASQQELWL